MHTARFTGKGSRESKVLNSHLILHLFHLNELQGRKSREMSYSVCIIDNDIPASGQQAQALGITDTGLLNRANLQLLLQTETWPDEIIKKLAERLVAETDANGLNPKWDVYGFTNPSFYINALNDGFFRSDVLVFDWEYPGAQNATATNSESILKEIVERTFCLIFVFSKADKKDEIETILAKPEFQPYKERLQYLDKAKDGAEQTSILLQRADEMYAANFSFKFASVLRNRSVQCADQILADMGKASLNDVKNLLAAGGSGKKDFIDFLAERFRASLASEDIYDLVEKIPTSAVADNPVNVNLASSVWSYRLYFSQETGDELVRRGDIVSVKGMFHLVLSADCDLGRFWKKNLGIINTVALHELSQTNISLFQMLTLSAAPADLRDKNLQSLLGKIGGLSEGPFVLPFVSVDGKFVNFIAVPKDLNSIKIDTPKDWNKANGKALGSHPMKYPYWPDAKRICTVSEPFLTPVIQHIFNTIAGYGVPDYPVHMKEILKDILDEFSKTVIPVAVTALSGAPQSPAATV
jgi:hypothetical protein